MVWGIFPVDPLPGEDSYYISAKGSYKVGRKGCDIIVNKDKGVSRIHAEIVVDVNHVLNKHSNASFTVRVKDCSKYGTFITRSVGSKEKVHEFPNKESILEDGDVISFGTGNALYRFCSVPFIFFICGSKVDQHLQDTASSIGARVTHNLNQECTHVLVDQHTPVKEDLLDAVLAKKPIVFNSFVEQIAEKRIHTAIPSYNSHLPTLMVDGVSVKFADPKTREDCLDGYTFVIELVHMYTFGDRLQSLLEVCGAKILSLQGFCSSSQNEENRQVVCVVPRGPAEKFDGNNKLISLSRVYEMDLIRVILTGHLDPSILKSPPVVVSSSCSTDETVVADSDAETESATSVQAIAANANEEVVQDVNKVEISMEHVASKSEDDHVTSFRNSSIAMPARKVQDVNKVEISMEHFASKSEDNHVTSFRNSSSAMTSRTNKVDESESGNLDIIYCQNLIVRDLDLIATTSSRTNSEVPNFKRFRKTNTQSGNSFHNLIPFSKYAYKDSDYGNEEIAQSLKEEKKRKQMEAVADDLFNNEKGRRRGTAGSIHGLLTR